MKTSTKLIIWAVAVSVLLLVPTLWSMYQARPSPVREAVIVDVNGCAAIDFNLCETVVDLGGVRLERGGDYGEIGDTLLVVQIGQSAWRAPTASQLRRHLEATP